MEIIKTILSSLLPKSLVEVGYVFIIISTRLPVVIDTIEAEVHQAVDDSICVLEVIAFFFRDKLLPAT